MYRIHFDSLGEFLTAVDKPVLPQAAGESRTISSSYDAFAGTHTFEEGLRLAREGWPQGREKLAKALALSLPLVPEAKTQASYGYDVAGAYPNVPMAIAGDPACMATPAYEERTTRPFYTFAINVTATYMIKAENITNRGAAICAAIDKLESQGARCEIILYWPKNLREQGPDKQPNAIASLSLKRADEPIEIDRIAFMLAHPAALRRLWFSLADTDPNLTPITHNAYGYALTHIPVEYRAKNTIVFGPMGTDNKPWATPEKAAKTLNKMLVLGGT